MAAKPDFDVIIIGGGPAGAGMGAYLGKAGVKCAVLEREIFPRPHVGESLVPSSTRVFKDLDFLPKMEEAKFPRKYGASWSSDPTKHGYAVDWEGLASESNADIRFEERAQPGVDRNYTYHVDRGKFDLLLLQHAHELGASVYEGVRVTQVDLPDGQDATVKFALGRKEVGLTAHVVVDASGRHTVLGSQLKLKVKDTVFDQYAIHTWFDGFDRRAMAAKPEFADYIHIHFLPITNTWVWQIPSLRRAPCTRCNSSGFPRTVTSETAYLPTRSRRSTGSAKAAIEKARASRQVRSYRLIVDAIVSGTDRRPVMRAAGG